jgi:hypothetical protein
MTSLEIQECSKLFLFSLDTPRVINLTFSRLPPSEAEYTSWNMIREPPEAPVQDPGVFGRFGESSRRVRN